MSDQAITTARPAVETTTFAILVSLSFCHLLNDMIQSLVPAIYPVLKTSYGLNFAQLGLITLAFQLTASMLQPVVGLVTDRRPMPFSLPVAMGFTLAGLALLSRAGTFGAILVAAALVGVGSSVFHPESSRVARMASGGRHGLAQSLFQVGGNGGSALGPLLAAFIVVPKGQGSIAWFTSAALVAILVLSQIGRWYRANATDYRGRRQALGQQGQSELAQRRVVLAIGVLGLLIFSKFFYTASLNSYYTLYLISKFHVSTESAELHLFMFLAAMAVGTLAGGPIGDKFGRKLVIWFSILGVFPFTFMLPFANLFWTGIMTIVIGLILSSAF
ncbi:MAG: MFS transporter [Acetobacteraceae bacterium]